MGYRQETDQIREIINEILKEHSAIPSVTERMQRCFDTAYGRRSGKSNDIILAAVEHYFFARKEVAKGGKAEYKAMCVRVVGYDAVKLHPILRRGLVIVNMIAGDDNPNVSPASAHSVEWGLIGANEGLIDWQGDHPDVAGLVV